MLRLLAPNQRSRKILAQISGRRLCPNCFDTLTPEKRAAALERQKQVELAKQRGEKHIGKQIRRG